MNFVSGSERSCTIWLDALSIDQDSKEDLQVQLKVMGEIYRQAEVVSVLLPMGDEGSYGMLRELAIVAQGIVNYEKSGRPNVWGLDEGDTEISERMESFERQMKDWAADLPKWTYWSRAWTFQEWAMAGELEITCEVASHKEILRDIKNIIVMAATIVGLWKNSQARLSGLTSGTLPDIVRIREETGTFLNEVRLHFPLADALVADNELEGDALREQTFLSSSSAIDSGTYFTTESPRLKELSIQKMLSLSLNAFTTSPREAGFKADLVACWASMCNIKYDYDKDDSVEVALNKVLSVLREKGLRIFNFHVNTTGAESDLKFMKYAAAMRQHNSRSKGLMFGSPAFTGRVDTVTHLRMCLEENEEVFEFESKFVVKLRRVSNASINQVQQLHDKLKTISTFKSLVSGNADGKGVQDVIPLIEELVGSTPTEQLRQKGLVTVSIGVKNDATMSSFNAWAIIPSNVETSKLFVARESLNGTLVLAYSVAPDVNSTRIVAYLNMTHQKDGTYLIKSDNYGVVDIVFRPPEKPLFEEQWMANLKDEMGDEFLDLGMMDLVNDRMFNVNIGLGLRKTAIRERSIWVLVEWLNWVAEIVEMGYDIVLLCLLWLYELVNVQDVERSSKAEDRKRLKRESGLVSSSMER